MNRDPRFLFGLGAVALVVVYLVWTGVSRTMVYYLTPSELAARVAEDPTFRDLDVKVGARVVAGSYARGAGELEHRFVVEDVERPDVSMPVVYRDVLPDTFADDVDVVLEGRLREDGVFEATTVLTKCGSRYEAMPEEGGRRIERPRAPGRSSAATGRGSSPAGSAGPPGPLPAGDAGA